MSCTVLDYTQAWRKDPDDDNAFVLDWSALLQTGDTIASSSWSADSSDITLGTDSYTDSTTSVQITGGECGKAYDVENTIVTTNGYTLSRTALLGVKAM